MTLIGCLAGKRVQEEDRIRQKKLQQQKNRWLRAKVHSGDEFYRPLELYLEYDIARKSKGFPHSARDECEEVLLEPTILKEAWARLDAERVQVGQSLGAGPDAYFDDWYVSVSSKRLSGSELVTVEQTLTCVCLPGSRRANERPEEAIALVANDKQVEPRLSR